MSEMLLGYLESSATGVNIMREMRRSALVFLVVLSAAVAAAASLAVTRAPAATGTIPSLWKNCTHVHKKYPHGVGKLHAHDRTSGTPVTNFTRSTRLYNLAMSYNRGLDRDKDGIACEQH